MAGAKLTNEYIAGMLDQRGTMMIRKPGNKPWSPYLAFSMTNPNVEILLRLREKYGGTVRYGWNKKMLHGNYIWSLLGRRIEPLINDVFPYLTYRKERYEIARRFLKLPSTHTYRDNKESLLREMRLHYRRFRH